MLYYVAGFAALLVGLAIILPPPRYSHEEKCLDAKVAIVRFEKCKNYLGPKRYSGECEFSVDGMKGITAAEKYLELCEEHNG